MSRDVHESADGPMFSAAQPNWSGEEALAPIREINEQYLDLLVKLTRAFRGHEYPFEWLRQFGPTLVGMSAEMRQRAAQCRLLLVSFQFQNAQWWRNARSKAPAVSWPRSAPRALALEMARTVLSYAWHTNRTAPHAAHILLGVTHPVAEVLGKLSQHELAVLAERKFSQLRPRWENQPFMWRDLLLAARSEERQDWSEVHMQGLQLLVTDSRV